MIYVKNVTKKFNENAGNFNINLSLKENEVYSIVGPNGSGKTTLIRQMLGFINSDEGEIQINDLSPWLERDKIMEFTGYVSGEVDLYNHFTGIKYLKLCAKFCEIVDWSFINKLIDFFEIDVNKKIKKMSKGMKQKIAIISAILHKPKFLILDEPTSGLDPVMQEQFISIIKTLKKEFNLTIIICSHVLDEVLILSDKIGFLKNGHLIEEVNVKTENLESLRKRFKEMYEREVIFDV